MKNYILTLLAIFCLTVPQACTTPQSPQKKEKEKKEVAIQLYSVRDLINNGGDLNKILKDLADMGYTSVEAANYNDGKFYGKTPQPLHGGTNV